ncbi:ZZ-type zinc finger-containing protein P35G2.11c [Cercospora zeina]
MASTHNSSAVSQDTLITIKISVNEQLKKLKLPLRDLGASVLPDKLRHVLDIKPAQHMLLERFSDSAGGYITLDQSNPQVFKTLIRAAKAKGKLRLKATVSPLAVPQEKEAVEVKVAPKQMSPVIVRSPMHPTQKLSNICSQPSQAPPPRESVSLDQRSIGSGIFQFRDALNSQQTLVGNEAPVPRPFLDQSTFGNVAAPVVAQKLPLRPREPVNSPKRPLRDEYSVYCNICGVATPDVHYHCGTCDGGDYDLCQTCVDNGSLCPGEGHWLIKRFSKNGEYVNSTTTRLATSEPNAAPEVAIQVEQKKEMPGTFTDDVKTIVAETRMPTRTCNSCVIVLPEREFVTCSVCEDFDLCIQCHVADKHGHHPAHAFEASTGETVLPLASQTKLAPGRNIRHNAICDGCDKVIFGVRHKCLNCPDWDYCNECIGNASLKHPGHRFAALFQPIADQAPNVVRHFGIFCDGPLCIKKQQPSFIEGVRYKCTICHDTDFCAACEALPGNHHNRTHPLIKLKTPVRHVSVSTENENQVGQVRVMGDRGAGSLNVPVTAPSPVRTVAEIKPTEVKKEAEPVIIPVKKYEASPVASLMDTPFSVLNARFVHDTIADGTVVEPETRFTQVWTMINPGPFPWPSGCSVRYVGGDNMLNVDNTHPASVSAINEATESNVVGREVAVGETVAFKVVMKAPVREGKSISYWRVKAADGTPFGNRLWCDIDVKKAEQKVVPAAPMAPVIPRMPIRQCGTRATVPLSLRGHPSLPSEQPPAYNSMDGMNLSARLAAMREQQKQRREQMLATLSAQREQLVSQGFKREDVPGWAGHSSSQMGKDALRQRVAHIKANIQKTREERDRQQAEHAKLEAAAAEKKAEEQTAKVKQLVQNITKQAEAEAQLERSQMVFPKLDKESPASSTYESATSSSHKGKAAYVENEDGEVERSATPAQAPAPAPVVTSPSFAGDDFVEIDDELEVLSANDENSEDDGFLTDEEYDILDASDHETVASR